MPLQRRLPKRGFTNVFRRVFSVINLNDLERFPAGTEVTPRLLLDQGVIRDVRDGVKVLGNGEINVPLTVVAHAFSRSAMAKIQAAGGQAEVL
jgi:large subunit ribosomal protein L15